MINRHHWHGPALLTIVTGILGCLVWSAPVASASCAAPPGTSGRSPNAFVGTVVDTAFGGREATVRTADGSTVTVLGTPWPREGVMSSVDRTYKLGATYEFHPTNDEDPYQDNACTATSRLSGKDIPESLQGDTTGAGNDVSDDTGAAEATVASASNSSELPGSRVLGAVALVVLGLGAALLWLRLGRLRQSGC